MSCTAFACRIAAAGLSGKDFLRIIGGSCCGTQRRHWRRSGRKFCCRITGNSRRRGTGCIMRRSSLKGSACWMRWFWRRPARTGDASFPRRWTAFGCCWSRPPGACRRTTAMSGTRCNTRCRGTYGPCWICLRQRRGHPSPLRSSCCGRSWRRFLPFSRNT